MIAHLSHERDSLLGCSWLLPSAVFLVADTGQLSRKNGKLSLTSHLGVDLTLSIQENCRRSAALGHWEDRALRVTAHPGNHAFVAPVLRCRAGSCGSCPVLAGASALFLRFYTLLPPCPRMRDLETCCTLAGKRALGRSRPGDRSLGWPCSSPGLDNPNTD